MSMVAERLKSVTRSAGPGLTRVSLATGAHGDSGVMRGRLCDGARRTSFRDYLGLRQGSGVPAISARGRLTRTSSSTA